VKVPYELLERISTRITNEVSGVNRVVLDLTIASVGYRPLDATATFVAADGL
jgi:hypothetical protein